MTHWCAESSSVAETQAIGCAMGRVLSEGAVVALHGDLGAGKTQFVRGLAQGMGLDPRVVSSPSFAIVQEYWPEQADQLALVHVDAWRLEPGMEESVGWTEPGGGELAVRAVLAVEWPDKIRPDWLGTKVFEVRITHQQDMLRGIEIVPQCCLDSPELSDQWRLLCESLTKECLRGKI